MRDADARRVGDHVGVWLLIPEGFFSIVQKPGEEQLCVRARVAADLDRLRARFMPALSETVETRGGDYRYRAWISRGDLTEGLAAIGGDLSYSNFKAEVARVDPERAQAYGRVWGMLGELQPGGPYS
jgi:hypothetical protein